MAKSVKTNSVDFSKLPGHIAIIMDGNGRWAKKHLLTRKAGHRAGAQNLRKLSEKMNELGFNNLTVYAFSTENWRRSSEEVYDLMNLMRDFIRQYIEDAKKNSMRINTIGDISQLDTDLQESIAFLKELTRSKDGMKINIAINYGGRDDIVRSAKRIAADVKSGELSPENITEQVFASYIDTSDDIDPELIIRTGGELRISNFLLWQCAYSEFYFCDTLWPDFSIENLLDAVWAFQNRNRRFGVR